MENSDIEKRNGQDRVKIDTYKLIRTLFEATSQDTGQAFLNSLVGNLASILGFKYTFIGVLAGDKKDRVRTLALWAGGVFTDPVEYELAGTPCDEVVGKSFCVFPDGVQALFPGDRLLVDMGAVSYAGVPLFDTSGNPIGIIAAIDDKPLTAEVDMKLIFSSFAARAGIALERKLAEQELVRVKNEIDLRVKERTTELALANQALREQIAERIRAEEALRESEEMYRTLAESAQDYIYLIERDFRVRYVNDYCACALGRSRSDITGSTIDEVLPAYLTKDLKDGINLIFETGRAVFRERGFSIGGREICLGTRLNPIFDNTGRVKAVLGISRDITERMLWTEEIQKERDKAQRYLDIAGAIIVVLDSEQKVTLINRKGCEILGYAEGEIIGKNWFDEFIPGSIRDELRKKFIGLMQGEIGISALTSFENPVLARGGAEKTIEWKNSLIADQDGRISGALSSGEDITERKRAEAERERLISDLKDAVSNIKTLKGLLPICASCKKIRDDKGYWRKIEVYIQEHSEADFSHGICPDCSKKFVF